MTITKLFDLESDGLNMAADGHHLYCLSKRGICKFGLHDGHMAGQNILFKKDGKARGVSVCDEYVFVHDFCDLYVLKKDDLQVMDAIRLGADASSDIGGVRCGGQKAYVSIRNGKMAVMDMGSKSIGRFDISHASFWDYTIVENSIYAGTVLGELMEIDKETMQVTKKAQLGKKNIYSVVFADGFLYTVSQDMTLQMTRADSFQTVAVAKKAVRGMAKILGVYQESLVVADTNKITCWDRQTLAQGKRLDFPTGSFNKGALLHGDRLFGCDLHSVYHLAVE